MDRGGDFAHGLLFDLMGTAEAWRMLHDPQVVGKMDSEQFYELCLAAGYSERESERAAADWALKRLQKDLPA